MAQTIELLKNVPITNTIIGLETLLTELCEKAALDLDETKQIYIDSLTITGDPALTGIDALTLGGEGIDYFSPATHDHDLVYLGIDATAADSNLLENQNGAYYLSWDNFTGKPESYSADLITDGTINKAYTAAEKTKLGNIEENADVTDAVNVASSIHGVNGKTTPVDTDTLPTIDSAASNSLKKITWANIKATLKTYTDTLYIGSVVDDTTPQLGGNLDVNGKTFTQTASATYEFGTDEKQVDFNSNNAHFTLVNNTTGTTIDWRKGNKQTIAPTSAPIYTFTAPGGACNLVLKLTQDSTAVSITWPAAVKWCGSTPAFDTDSAVYIICFFYDGTNYWATAVEEV